MSRSALWLTVAASVIACDDEQQAVPPDSEVSVPEAGDCVDEDLSASATGSTVDAGDDLLGSCGREGGLDRVYRFTAPEAGRYAFDTVGSGFDTVLYVLDSCGGEELACNEDDPIDAPASRVGVGLEKGQEILVVVDGYDGAHQGELALNVALLPPSELECDDRIDQDLDDLVDCADPDCAEAQHCAIVCPDQVSEGFPTAVTGTTIGLSDESIGSCDTSVAYSSISPDASIAFTAPEAGRYGFGLTTAGTDFDTVLYVLDGCGGEELACADGFDIGGEMIQAELAAGQTVMVVVDGYGDTSGSFELRVFAPTRREVCDDQVDNDFDGPIDCLDPDCSLDPACPEICDNGLDEDADGAVDCADLACVDAPGCESICPEETLTGELPLSTSRSTVGLNNDHQASCGYGTASDRTVAFTAPADGAYTFDTAGSGFDTVLYVLDSCGGEELACDDEALAPQSEVQVELVAGQEVIVVVDGYGTDSGEYVLNVR